MSPLQAWEHAERQKRRLAAAFRGRILRLHRVLSAGGGAHIPHGLTPPARRTWREACAAFAAAPPDAILPAYGDIVMRYGLKRIDPKSKTFARDLRQFYRNYVTNFPLPEEQTSRADFRTLWQDSSRGHGYQEVGYSVLCPLTGHYIMGINFSIQPASDSVHFIYGFVNPIARGLAGFSARMIAVMRSVARGTMAAWFERHPAERPAFQAAEGPLILFEKNILQAMPLPEILMDSARIDIDRPPTRKTRLAASSISQSLRDLVWDRNGARIIGYNYIQSSLEGIVRVADDVRDIVIAYLNRAPLDDQAQQHAIRALANGLGGRVPGCRNLHLCAFVQPGTTRLPAAQIRLSNEIFQGISVVQNEAELAEDIYFQAQMASLADNTVDGCIGLRRIAANGDFLDAEQQTKRLLAVLTWPDLGAARDRTYAAWLVAAGTKMADDARAYPPYG